MGSLRILMPLLLVFASLVATLAQDPPQLKVYVQLTSLDVSVNDAAGRPVTNLKRSDFTILEDGQPREILNFDSAEAPYNILLLFDRSSSTEDQWQYLATALSRFLALLPPQHRVAIAAFDDKTEMLFDWKGVREFSRQAIAIPSRYGGTDVYRALEWSVQELRETKGRAGVIAFTDGVDNRLSKQLVSFDKNRTPSIAPMEQDRDFEKMLRVIQGGRNPIYFIAVNTDLNPDPREPHNSFNIKQRTAARLRMERVAERSNGVVHLPKRMDDIEALYATIARELGTAYSLGFTPGHPAADGSFHRIEVRVADKSMKVVQSREGYYAR
ncbi:MAG TPA: VWA domain-containing protein [Terriglobia bacterium]|nr:VWA domain-containing protein [Terriglobia bacterium]